MSKYKRYPIRFYRAHDLDLVTYMETHKISMNLAIRVALTNYLKGKYFIIKAPESEENIYYKRTRHQESSDRGLYDVGDPHYAFVIQLMLDKNKDKEVISFLERLQNGFINNVVKSILRFYLAMPCADICFREGAETEEDRQRYELFMQGKKIYEFKTKRRYIKNSSADKMSDITEESANEQSEQADVTEVNINAEQKVVADNEPVQMQNAEIKEDIVKDEPEEGNMEDTSEQTNDVIDIFSSLI